MSNNTYITIISGRQKITIDKSTILYAISRRKYLEVHVYKDDIFKTFMPLFEMEAELGKGFVKVQRGCIVSERAIDHIADKIYLVNGEELKYTVRNKKEIVGKLRLNKKLQISKPDRGVYQIVNPGVFKTPNMGAYQILNPSAAMMPRKRKPVRKDEFERIRKLLEMEQPDSDEKQEACVHFIYKKREYAIAINTILYVAVNQGIIDIHTNGGDVYQTRMSLKKIKEQLGDGFIKVNTNTLAAVRAIHEIGDQIYLCNGETLPYHVRNKKAFIEQLVETQKRMIGSFAREDIPKTYEEYCRYYSGFEHMPFAFADIEMVFDEEYHAVDWIFRYGNPALAKLEKLPLKVLIGSSFGSLFYNMDSKWLRSYERAALYGEKLEMIDYSPEIDTYLKVICFQTFKGHCGCILSNIDEIKFTKNSGDAEKALRLYFGESNKNI